MNIPVRDANERNFSKFKLTEVTEANNYLTQKMDTGKDLNKHEITQTLNLEKLVADFLKERAGKDYKYFINNLYIIQISLLYYVFILFNY